MRSEAIIMLLVLAAGVIYCFVILPEKEKKKSWNKEAAEIAKQFGNGIVSLFKFPTADQRGAGYVYTLIDTSNFQRWNETEKIKSYHVLIASHENGEIKEKDAMKKVDYLRSILPYDLRLQTATMDFAEWEKRVLEHSCCVTYEYY